MIPCVREHEYAFPVNCEVKQIHTDGKEFSSSQGLGVLGEMGCDC